MANNVFPEKFVFRPYWPGSNLARKCYLKNRLSKYIEIHITDSLYIGKLKFTISAQSDVAHLSYSQKTKVT